MMHDKQTMAQGQGPAPYRQPPLTQGGAGRYTCRQEDLTHSAAAAAPQQEQ